MRRNQEYQKSAAVVSTRRAGKLASVRRNSTPHHSPIDTPLNFADF